MKKRLSSCDIAPLFVKDNTRWN